MFPKPKRIENKKLLATYSKMSCEACGSNNEVHAHHIKTKGSGGDDVSDNLIPLCVTCHTLIHKIGNTKFVQFFSHLNSRIFECETW